MFMLKRGFFRIPRSGVRIAASFLFLAALLPGQQAGQSQSEITMAKSPWPMVQHDPQHTGRSELSGPQSQPDLLWTYPLMTEGTNPALLSIAGDGSLLVNLGGRLVSFDAFRQEILWQVSLGDSQATALAASDGTTYLGSSMSFYHISPTGNIISYSLMDPNYYSGGGATFGPDGAVYFGHDGLWSFTPQGLYRFYILFYRSSDTAPAIGLDGRIFMDGCAFSSSGQIIWCTGDQSQGSYNQVSVGPDDIVYFRKSLISIVAMNAKTGAIHWEFPAPFTTYIESKLAITPQGGICFSADTHIFCLNPDKSVALDYEIKEINPVTGYPGKILFGVVLDRDGNIFVCTLNSHCYCISPKGEKLWDIEFSQISTQAPRVGSLPLIAANGMFYIVTNFGELMAFGEKSQIPQIQVSPDSIYLSIQDPQPFLYKLVVTSTLQALAYRVETSPTDWMTASAPVHDTPGTFALNFNLQQLVPGIHRGEVVVYPKYHGSQSIRIPVQIAYQVQKIFVPLLTR